MLRMRVVLQRVFGVAVSSSPRPWIDEFALPEKSNMAVTKSDPDPKSIEEAAHGCVTCVPGSVKQPVIDYEKLRYLIKQQENADRSNKGGQSEAHQLFMENYQDIFVPEEPKMGLPVHSINRSLQKLALSDATSEISVISKAGTTAAGGDNQPAKHRASSDEQQEPSHDIRDFLPLLHEQRRSENPVAIRAEAIKTLRRLLRKLPFERTAEENDRILNAVKNFSQMNEQVPPNVLKELCVVAQIDIWKEENITIFGNSGLHLVLKGAVHPQIEPHIRKIGQPIIVKCPTPEPPEEPLPMLGVGDCFGTLDKIEGRDPNSRILTVSTAEESNEFMKITTADYKRVIAQMRQREETEKVSLLQSSKAYKLWSRQSLIKVASLIKWLSFTANTVLSSEGYKSPFIAVVKKGECHVLRQVEILHTLPNGKKEHRLKQVVMGRLGVKESFGEISVTTGEPMTCSIITASKVEMGVIEPERLEELDEITIQLLQQSSEPTYGNLTQDDIHDEYISQELKREWNQYKHRVVVDTINSTGVRPGYGKWAK